MATVLVCLALNIVAFFYLHAWRPVADLLKWFRLSRQIRAMRIAGLLLLLLAMNVTPVHAQNYSDGGDALIARYQHQAQETTGYPALDNAIRYVWNNCGKLMLVFSLLAAASILNSKLKADNETYGDVLRREAAERWEEETEDDSIHNPFDSPEGMQPTTQYVPVRTKR